MKPTIVLVHAADASVTAAEVCGALRNSFDVAFLLSSSVSEREAQLVSRMGRSQVVTDVVRDGRAFARSVDAVGVFTFSDRLVVSTADLADSLGLPSVGATAARAMKDKGRFRALASAAGLSRIGSMGVRTEGELLERVLPGQEYVLKPREGVAGRNTFRIDGGHPLSGVVKGAFDGRSYVLEDFITDGPPAPLANYVSCETFIRNGAVEAIYITRKLPLSSPFREVGQFCVPGDEASDALTSLLAAVHELLGVQTGVTHTEVKIAPWGPEIIEVNGRLGGLVWELYRRAGAGDFVHAAAQLTSEIAPTALQPVGHLTYQYAPLAPVRPCIVSEVPASAPPLGEAEVVYRSHVRPGDRLPGGVDTRTLGVATGVATSVEAMCDDIRQLSSMLSYTFDFGHSVEVLTAGELCPASIPNPKGQS